MKKEKVINLRMTEKEISFYFKKFQENLKK